MTKRIYQLCFIFTFICLISLPFLHTDWTSGGISEDENRTLSDLPLLFIDGQFNDNYTSEFENWFMDHLGFRKWLINCNASLQFNVFDRLLEQSNYYLGKNGDINYATNEMLNDYAHLNLRNDEDVEKIGSSYQTISDWLNEKEIPFFYIQCWDKHSIYPEQFMSSINQIGDISKTDQVISYLRNHTTVNTISLKEVLLNCKGNYEVYSNWGDPTHWTERGAYIGYRYIMEQLNETLKTDYRILSEEDYDITTIDKGITLNSIIHEEDMLETFNIKNPYAISMDTSVMGSFSEDVRHSVWNNPNADNDDKLLLMCDSYINSFIIEDIAESFSEVWLVWGDYTEELDTIVDMYHPDLVIYECAERVDRSHSVVKLADKLTIQ